MPPRPAGAAAAAAAVGPEFADLRLAVVSCLLVSVAAAVCADLTAGLLSVVACALLIWGVGGLVGGLSTAATGGPGALVVPWSTSVLVGG